MDTYLSMNRGEVHFGSAQTVAPGNALVGDVVEFRDTENGTQRRLRLRKVRNGSGGSLTSSAGRAVSYAADGFGLVISGYSKLISDAHFAGWIDEKYNGVTIANNDLFWIVEAGPADHDAQTDDLNAYVGDFAARRFATVRYENDFHHGTTLPGELVSLGSSPVLTVQDVAGGALKFAHAATTNDASAGFAGAVEQFLFAAKQPLVWEMRVRPISSTFVNNFCFGFCNAAAAAVPISTAGALSSSFSGAVIYGLEADSAAPKWKAAYSIGSSQSIDTDCGTITTNTWYNLRIEWIPGATTGVAKFYINGELVHTSSAIAFASATEMKLVALIVTGDATVAASFDVDFVSCHQIRAIA